MEYLDGEMLADRLKHGALPLKRALAHSVDIAEALHEALEILNLHGGSAGAEVDGHVVEPRDARPRQTILRNTRIEVVYCGGGSPKLDCRQQMTNSRKSAMTRAMRVLRLLTYGVMTLAVFAARPRPSR